ncbi:hypothetical protein CVT24_003308 [Panaeolus cyanescens]|uniref:choline-phosphate cytidylyltransferase n=1 Tax=Panaeolus cyanescens TaxID=181874 RepID=A0A409Y6W0_9AGAR|nr:hypothetical protein CVT24_003308 [Panaeolus cyanescens]
MSVETARRTLHSKRSFGKYPSKLVDSPAYDASEEDNDPLTDDSRENGPPIASIISSRNTNTPGPTRSSHLKHSSTLTAKNPRHTHLITSDSDGVDSPTYDGDVESSTTLGRTDPPALLNTHHHNHSTSSVSTLSRPGTPAQPANSSQPLSSSTPSVEKSNPMSSATANNSASSGLTTSTSDTGNTNSSISKATGTTAPQEPAVPETTLAAFNPAALTPEDIQAFVQKAIDGEDWRKYKINPPPKDRPVRVYADGVYDLFHFGHALQLRQAKLSFPSVYLLAGVNSDEQVWSHKARTVMSHAERLEAARHCRWVDEVVAEAPWVIDEAFMEKYQIDYVAHDEDAYASAGHDDVYGYVKSQGKFIPTRRTPGVSTSELLERIVSGYRNRDFDDKLTKMGHAELRAEGSDYDDQSRRASRAASPTQGGWRSNGGSGHASPTGSNAGSASLMPSKR